MGITGGYRAAAGGDRRSHREADRRGAVYDQRADSSSFPGCRTRREERRTTSRHAAHGEGFDWADDFGNPALLRAAGRSGGFSPQDGISGEGSSGTVGSIVSAGAIAFPLIWLEGRSERSIVSSFAGRPVFPPVPGNSVGSPLCFPFQVERSPAIQESHSPSGQQTSSSAAGQLLEGGSGELSCRKK